MKPNQVVRILLVALIAIPVAIVLALVMLPVWRWFEASTDIESIGHSGPATWCFVATYVMAFLVGILIPIRSKGPQR